MRASRALLAAVLGPVAVLWSTGTVSAATGLTSPTLSTTSSGATVSLSGTSVSVGTTGVKTTTSPTSSTSSTSGGGGGSGSGSVVSAPPLQTCISCTTATAGPGGSSASATAVTVAGQNLSGGSSGQGSVAGTQDAYSPAIAFPANPLISFAVADWIAQASGGSAHSRAAIADVSLAGGQVATIALLESDSSASYSATPTGSKSTGSAETNGATVSLGSGALVIVLLHSDASSSGAGNVYLFSIQGNQVPPQGSVPAGGIPIAIPGVGTITLLSVSASGGITVASVGSVVSQLPATSPIGPNPFTGTILGIGVSSGSGGTTGGVQGVSTGGGPSAVAAATAPVPATGVLLGMGGLLLLLVGAGLALAGRRRGDAAA